MFGRNSLIRNRLAVMVAACALAAGAPSLGQAADAAKLFPGSTLVYADLGQPGPLLDYALHPDVLMAIAKSEQFQQATALGHIEKLKELVSFFEGKIGVDWQSGLRKLVGGGVQIGFDPVSMAPLLIVQASDADFLNKFHAALLEAVEQDQKASRVALIKMEDYRGHKGYSFSPGESHAIVGNMLLVSPRPEVVKRAIDRHLDANGKSLADVPEFQKAKQLAGGNPTGWAFLRVEQVINLPGIDKVFEATRGNPAVEVLFGGILETVKKAPFGVATLNVTYGRGAKVNVRLPRDPGQVAENRRWHFAAHGGQAATPLRVKGHIATISTYRDLEGMWNAREELFNEEIGRNLTQAESQLALFFGKQDFGADVLAELGPRTTFVAAQQEFPTGQPVPTNRVPAFALVWDLPHADEMSQDLLSVYQKFVGLANLGGGQQGFAPLLLSSEEHRGVTISKASYKAKKDMPLTNAPIQFNFSPSCAQIGQRFVIGSTSGIVRDLVDLFQDAQAGAPGDANVLVDIDTAAVSAALELNREFFVSQQMLSQGKSHDEAAAQLSLLYDLLRKAIAGRMKLIDTSSALDLEVSVGQLP